MRKTWLIIQREYLTRVRKRLFIITTLLAPLGMGIIVMLPILLSKVSSEEQSIGVIDRSGIFENKLQDEGAIHFTYLNDTYEYAKKSYERRGLTGKLGRSRDIPYKASRFFYTFLLFFCGLRDRVDQQAADGKH